MVKIVFECHGTSFDNESGVSSGWFDVELSPLGKKQAKELGRRRKDQDFDAVFCSDLRRSFDTAVIAFGSRFPIIKDSRLRECNYGDLTRHQTSEVESQRLQRVKIPFPNGESYERTSIRIKSFLDDLAKNYDSKTILIVGHAATRYGLEHLLNSKSLEEIVVAPWKWQPGWEYELK